MVMGPVAVVEALWARAVEMRAEMAMMVGLEKNMIVLW